MTWIWANWGGKWWNVTYFNRNTRHCTRCEDTINPMQSIDNKQHNFLPQPVKSLLMWVSDWPLRPVPSSNDATPALHAMVLQLCSLSLALFSPTQSRPPLRRKETRENIPVPKKIQLSGFRFRSFVHLRYTRSWNCSLTFDKHRDICATGSCTDLELLQAEQKKIN